MKAGFRDPFPLPRNLVDSVRREGREGWLSTLRDTVEELAGRWSLTLDEPFQPGGSAAWVAPASDASGAELVLKVGWRHSESLHEAEGLRFWAGRGAVRLHAVAQLGDSEALLLERCLPGTQLSHQPEEEQDLAVASLLRRLWRHPPPGHSFRTLQSMCEEWAGEFEEKMATGDRKLDTGMAREGIELFRSLPTTATDAVLLCTDLHAENVLAAQREPWLVIDPKPFVGDPTYDPLQHMLNCRERLVADPRALAARMSGLLELDSDRLLLWLFARCVQESPDWPHLADVAHRISPR